MKLMYSDGAECVKVGRGSNGLDFVIDPDRFKVTARSSV